ncbi:hypothetical protein BTO09_02455 [Gilvibacter sp. SZ-19]|jgi:hypothetical protein|uniref:hypothetical protein n=1 Tax=unclassified Gilvibacter TaxID=2625242 RepID=UPI000B3CA9CA|nr:hypothetical protein [Gilvibacter sp. SZ-19]ARV11267.1 hypothetical protein BTO09_02455 [Gilvibacter sp. SZ-19]
MKDFKAFVMQKLQVDKRLLAVYVVLYFAWGMGMDWFGATVQIATFTYWWQVITVYLLYMIPISLILRGLPFHMQYAYGLIAMGLLEFGGYALETSIAFPNNILDQFFGERNFALAMALFFALYFPLGNWAVSKIYSLIWPNQGGSPS